jgi:hypothetical protein
MMEVEVYAQLVFITMLVSTGINLLESVRKKEPIRVGHNQSQSKETKKSAITSLYAS